MLGLVEYLKGTASLEVLEQLHDRIDVQGSAKIGSGSLGDVILARDRKNNWQVAVKVISLKRVLQKHDDDSKVRREVQVMRELQHPNIVRLLDVLSSASWLPNVEFEPPYLCIVMEHVRDSEPLSNTIRRHGGQPKLATAIVPQLASALSLMHQRGLVHRDVWSENVLVSKQDWNAVLVDLGCAEYYQSGPPSRNNLNIPYMSPQAARGQRQEPGDDCWALGLLLSEIVTGRFVADRLGRTDIPFHCASPTLLVDACCETVSRGGPLLGGLAEWLLDLESARRASMLDVLAQMSSGSSVNTSAGTMVAATSSPSPPSATSMVGYASIMHAMSSGSPKNSLTSWPAASNGGGSVSVPLEVSGCLGGASNGASGVASLFTQGQHVTYLPRSHNVRHPAVIMSRIPGRQAWQIQLHNGAMKEVDDADAWRLSPTSAAPTHGHGSAAAPSGPPGCAQAQATQRLQIPPQLAPPQPLQQASQPLQAQQPLQLQASQPLPSQLLPSQLLPAPQPLLAPQFQASQPYPATQPLPLQASQPPPAAQLPASPGGSLPWSKGGQGFPAGASPSNPGMPKFGGTTSCAVGNGNHPFANGANGGGGRPSNGGSFSGTTGALAAALAAKSRAVAGLGR